MGVPVRFDFVTCGKTPPVPGTDSPRREYVVYPYAHLARTQVSGSSGRGRFRLRRAFVIAITFTMSTTSPPPVVHSLRCTCNACCAVRAAEVRRRLEDARREERAGRELAHLEAMSGPVYARLGLAKAQPGTRAAIVRRYGGAR
jgi:hypothetical protein